MPNIASPAVEDGRPVYPIAEPLGGGGGSEPTALPKPKEEEGGLRGGGGGGSGGGGGAFYPILALSMLSNSLLKALNDGLFVLYFNYIALAALSANFNYPFLARYSMSKTF